jgi:hypothetical protein
LVWALVRRQWDVLLVGLWTVGMASLVAGRLIGLPGARQLQSFAVVIALYIPVGLLVGWLIGDLVRLLSRLAGRAAYPLTACLLIGLALWGAKEQVKIVDRSYVMVTRPDTRAFAWIKDNLPPDAKFLVEGFRIYSGLSAVGSDAGWWIPLFTGRANTMPPQYALLNEVPDSPDYGKRVVDLVKMLETATPASPEALAVLCEWGISHVYIGQTQGATGAGVTQLFTPEELLSQPAFHLVYQQDRVHIFTLATDACEKLPSLP